MTRPVIASAHDLGDRARIERMRNLARAVLVSRRASGARATRYHAEAKAAIRPHLYVAIRALRRARDAIRANDPSRCNAELARAEQAISDARHDYLRLLALRQHKAKSKSASSPRLIDKETHEAIRNEYKARLAAGKWYGAVRAIAAQFKTNETTVHEIVKDLKPPRNKR